jgi:hypothetical protein
MDSMLEFHKKMCTSPLGALCQFTIYLNASVSFKELTITFPELSMTNQISQDIPGPGILRKAPEFS